MKLISSVPNREIAGLRSEILGLVILLAAAIWQAWGTDWYDRFDLDYHYMIQGDVNNALLENQKSLASMIRSTSNEQMLRDEGDRVLDRNYDTVIKVMEGEKRRAEVKKGEAKLFKNIRLVLALVGSICLILGKYLVLTHKSATVGEAKPKVPAA